MASFRVRFVLVGLLAIALAAVAVAANQLPALGAGALLHPLRRHVDALPPEGCSETAFSGAGINLAGWKCRASGYRRGTLVYLHGAADNRVSSVAAIQRFRPLGFDVVAYDSRAHGDSGGDICTYGFFEKQDLRRVLDATDAGPIVLMGGSLGAAVAIQSAVDDPRVSAVVAVETFSDLRTIATERAPFFFTRGTIARAFEVAERQGRLRRRCSQPGGRSGKDRRARAGDSRRRGSRNATRSRSSRVRGAARTQASDHGPGRAAQRLAPPGDLGSDRALGSGRARAHLGLARFSDPCSAGPWSLVLCSRLLYVVTPSKLGPGTKDQERTKCQGPWTKHRD